jgi:hypothetical protein
MTKKEYQKEIEERVYNITDYISILKDVMEDIVHQTHMMSDDDIKYDRGKFIGQTDMVDLDRDKQGYYDYDKSIHTLSTEIEQLKRYGKILYSRDGEVDEQNKHKIDKDFFDEREIDTDVYTKYKN